MQLGEKQKALRSPRAILANMTAVSVLVGVVALLIFAFFMRDEVVTIAATSQSTGRFLCHPAMFCEKVLQVLDGDRTRAPPH